ncbi:unnamed protein product [Adineta steineri]|uniref:Uncharacterized protein n=1 Tax=Adineta steineri TaxID=433720 RepID=A0A814BNP1_9BILA|nr:unnamed protein product [Adineta steineri]CAF1444849.1 unnamed protein product [Adineta steineri]CAF1445438.1 unnamed protein product [Adineta steineri]CAF1453151.1 unnamed protein product [Adineta steineri]CAF1631158.1 unnamed protein product [Adineta steineri]
MSFYFFVYLVLLLVLIDKYKIYSIPACVIIDTNMLQRPDNDLSLPNNRSSSSLLLRNLRMLDHQRSSALSELVVDPIPLSYIDIKQTTLPPLMNINHSSLKKSLTEAVIDQTFSPCPINLLSEIETKMVVPFEFRRLRIEQPDHRTKFFDDDPRETVPDLSTAVYERRSDPDGLRFCRTCRDGFWTQLTVCDTVRCDAELLRANPRLVTEWGEIKPLDGGALYTPTTVFAIYAFAFGPHCKRCESNGQWSRYALPELCAGIKFFGQPSTTTTTTTTTSTATILNSQTLTKYAKLKQTSTLSSTKSTSKKQ